MEVRVLRADPAGNITLFVLDEVAASGRAALASHLMACGEFNAEQVAFCCAPRFGSDGRMEMMGGEFCGNATRAYGMLLARRRGERGKCRLMLETSGCDHPVAVDVDPAQGTARAEMPLPRFVRRETVGEAVGTLVHLGGIAHLVIEGVPPEKAFFDRAEPLFRALGSLEAYGVIFLEAGGRRMTPLVKVPATDTLVWEGSCASGSLACAVARSAGTEGLFEEDYLQPAGEVRASVVRKNGALVEAYVGGKVALGEPVTIELT